MIGCVGMAQNCSGKDSGILDIRKHFFTMRVVNTRNRLPSEVADAPYLPVFNRHLDNALNLSLSVIGHWNRLP